MNQFGNFLYELRKEKGLTQVALADKLNITNKAVSKWETGDAYPETAQLLPLAKALGVSVDELLRGQKIVGAREEALNFKPVKPFSFGQIMTITAGVALIMLGVIAMIILGSFNHGNTSVFVLLNCVAVAVVMFNMTSFTRRLKSAELEEPKYKKGLLLGLLISIGVAICIITPGVFVLMENFLQISEVIRYTIFMVMIIIALMLIIPSATLWGNFVKEHHVPSSDDEEYPTAKAKKTAEAICGSLMLTATAAYLMLGFLANLWHPGWIVFPIAGLLCAIVSILFSGLHRNK